MTHAKLWSSDFHPKTSKLLEKTKFLGVFWAKILEILYVDKPKRL